MAFATTNIRSATMGNLKAYAGDWSGSEGDASGSLTLNGGRVYMAQFQNQDADNPGQDPLVDISASGSTITLTVHNHLNVTNGRFIVIYA